MNRSYSKIRHIQEANIRLEKRLLSEQPVDTYDPVLKRLGKSEQEDTSHPDPIIDRIFSKLKPYGFVTGSQYDLGVDSKGRYRTIEKPGSSDYEGVTVTFNMMKEPFEYTVQVIKGGELLLNKKWVMNASLNNSIEGLIMNAIKPYLTMKIKPKPSDYGNDPETYHP